MADKVIIEIDFDESKAKTSFGKIEKGLGDAGDKGGEKAGKSFSDSFSGVVESFLGNLLSDLFQEFVKEINNQLSQVGETTSKLEVFETQFKTLLGSAKAAQDQLEELQNFAATTPFKIDGLALSTRQLLSFGVAQKDIIPTLRQLGDLAAGTGSRIDELTIPFGRLISTQKLTLIELDKFADRGVNLFKKLSDQTGIPLKNIRDEISKGRVAFGEFTKALDSLTGVGGKFFDSTISQSKTLAGVTSTLQDAFFNLRGAIGAVIRPFLVQDTIDKINIINKFTKVIKDNSKAIRGVLFDIAQIVIDNVIRPLETVAQVSSKFTLVIAATFAQLVNGIADSLGSLGDLLAKIPFAENNPIVSGLRSIRESSKNSFGAAEKDIGGFIKKINDLDGSITGVAQTFVDNVRTLAEGTKETLSDGVDLTVDVKVSPPEDAAVLKIRDQLAAIGTFISGAQLKVESANLAIGASFKTTEATILKSSQAIGKAIKNAFVTGVASSFQIFANNLVQGKNLFEGFGKSILGILGDMAIAIGKTALLAGITIQSLFGLQGAQAAAAGVALIAIGSVLKSIAGSGGLGAGAGGSAGGGGGFAGGGAGAIGAPEAEEIQEEPNTIVNLTVQGDILDSQDTPRRLADLLNAGFDNENVLLKQGIA